MNKLQKLFQTKKNNILSIYITAGFPNLDDTVKICKELEKNGVDLIEIGVPFSDSLVDGPTIQASNEQSLTNGMNLEYLLEQIAEIKNEVSIPLVLMSCANPIIQYGVERLIDKLSAIGIDGVIIPDLPVEEFESSYLNIFDQANINPIFLITNSTSDERIKKIDSLSKSFIYVVSSDSTTGNKLKKNEAFEKYFKRLDELKLNNSTLIGFGISDNESLTYACSKANGASIGSAFIRSIGKGKIETNIKYFISNLYKQN